MNRHLSSVLLNDYTFPMPAFPLGPFELTEPLGRGGMGVVWRGRHTTQGLPVAVKVLTDRATRDPAVIEGFKSEVRAAAGLDHPNIAMVFDHGLVDHDSALKSEGQLPIGSPYLVMELADAGSLVHLCGRVPWDEAWSVMLCLLDALAHAHARGVIHRDIKPSNVLLAPSGKSWVRPGLKLTDFGIARAVRADEAVRSNPELAAAGTPGYMAPEQIDGLQRDQGPWTDLYAVGCLCWALVTGSPPFGTSPVDQTILGHLLEEPPELIPRVAIPAGLEDWLRRLLAKSPPSRYTSAADAAWGLLQLGRATPLSAPPLPMEDEPEQLESTVTMAPDRRQGPPLGTTRPLTLADPLSVQLTQLPTVVLGSLPTELRRPLRPALRPSMGSERPDIPVPPMPIDWRRTRVPPAPLPLVRVGLGLYGLRSINLVGREAECSILWRALWETRCDSQPRVVVLRGPAGCGKSRLAAWLCRRASEVGAATSTRAVHSENPGPTDGLAGLVTRTFACESLAAPTAQERIEDVCRDWELATLADARRLADLVAPTASSAPFSAAERHALLRRLLQRQAAQRPVVVWLDDVQWGHDALEFARFVLDKGTDEPCQVVLVLTARDEALAVRPAEQTLLEELLACHNASSLSLGPLDREDRMALVRQLLDLEPGLAARVVERTAGNPLFAVQLVGDWVARKALEPGPSGFRLKKGVSAELPGDLQQVWADRVDQLLAQRPASDRLALELAATLGQDVDSREWLDACRAAGVLPGEGLVDALLGARLATTGSDGVVERWSLVHGMLRESILARAARARRLRAHHETCADVIQLRGGPGASARIGRHLVAAGRYDEALQALEDGADQQLTSGDLRAAASLLLDREGAIEALGPPDGDDRWGQGWLKLAQVLSLLGDHAASVRWGRRVVEGARAHGWLKLLCGAVFQLGRTAQLSGDLVGASDYLREALALSDRQGDAEVHADALTQYASLLLTRSRFDEAEHAYKRSAREWARLGSIKGQIHASNGLGRLAAARGDLGGAMAHYHRARNLTNHPAAPKLAAANCYNNLGECARAAGDLGGAEAWYREAALRYDAIGVGYGVIAQVNIALIQIEQGHYASARPVLVRGLDRLEARGSRIHLAPLHTAVAACAAGTRDWAGFDHHLALALEIIDKAGIADPDMALMARIAGQLAAQAGDRARAHAAYDLSIRMWQMLGRADKVDAVERLAIEAG